MGEVESWILGLKVKRIVSVFVAVVLVMAVVACGAAFLYWLRMQGTPEYSLALIIDSAQRRDSAAFDELVDTDTIVENFVPQVTGKAVEIYGRGLPQTVVSRLAVVSAPLMPAVKERARIELPKALRRETVRFADIPFVFLVLGADGYFDISVENGTATVRSKLPDHNFRILMRQNGSQWRIVGINDEELATRIAQAIGEQVIGAAANENPEKAVRSIGIENAQDLIREVERIFE